MDNRQRKNRLYIIIAVIALALIGFFAYLYQKNDSWQWGENYQQDNKNPYGLHIIRQLMQVYFPKDKLKFIDKNISKSLPIDPKTPTNYVFMGAMPYFDSTDVKHLTTFVRNGNTAMLLVKTLPPHLVDEILRPYRSVDYLENEAAQQLLDAAKTDLETDTDSPVVYTEEDTTAQPQDFVDADLDNIDIDSLIEAREADGNDGIVVGDDSENTDFDTPEAFQKNNSELFLNEKTDTSATLALLETSDKKPLKYTFFYRKKATEYSWNSIDISKFTTNKTGDITVLGHLNKKSPNFIRIKYGKGFFYIHSTPLAFTNYYLLAAPPKNYAEQVLNYLPDATTWWDEPAKTYRDINGDGAADNYSPEVALNYNGPLDFVLSQPSLRNMWYILLALLALFVVFRAKRRQRIMPILPTNKNTALQFIKNIGRLYFLQNNHQKLADQQLKYFKHTLRNRFGLPVHLPEPELIPRIAQKTGFDEAKIAAIFQQYHLIQRSEKPSDQELIDLYLHLDRFYKNNV